MKRVIPIVILAAGLYGIAAGREPSDDAKSLARLTVPDEKGAAAKAVQEWLIARGLDCEVKDGNLRYKKDGITFIIEPIVGEKRLDRLLVSAIYDPKDEFKDSKDLDELAALQNRSQNFLRVFIQENRTLLASCNLTFYDELTAREFDAFVEQFVSVLREFVVTKESAKILK